MNQYQRQYDYENGLTANANNWLNDTFRHIHWAVTKLYCNGVGGSYFARFATSYLRKGSYNLRLFEKMFVRYYLQK
jgi:hypothetical protein